MSASDFIKTLIEMRLYELFEPEEIKFKHSTHKKIANWHKYDFDHNGKSFSVIAYHNKENDHAKVSFMSGKDNFDMTGSHPKDAVKIISKVTNVVRHHIENNKDISHVIFTADHQDQGRQKLYHHMAHRFGTSVDVHDDNDLEEKNFKVRVR